MTDRWKMNRAGLINFWYYDDEEFHFSDGRLLLRGSNGSGKSVTMQSFVPLLLDGNKSPERLDPFGSRARKMENYLLGENEEEEERTGYIYMEFIKEHSKSYITIGIGLRARKNKKMDSWGFSIIDGRRIGHEFYLYKKMGQKIPLSKKELQNRIGTGGEVWDSSKDYMKMVNKLLFGYEDIDDYDELIKLLIQIRSPKLSKDFKPTVIYEIMSNSLQTLSDEDLRSMSEAIENMDNVKSQFEMLKESKGAADRINNAYESYNKYVLVEKANDYVNSKKELDLLVKQRGELDREKQKCEEQYKQSDENIKKLEEEQEILEDKKSKLNKHDVVQLKEELNKIEIKLKQLEEDKKIKESQLNEKETKERELHYSYKEGQEKADTIEQSIMETLEEMDEIAEGFKFDEQSFFMEEIIKDIKKEYNFSYIRNQISAYQKTIQKSIDILKEEERTNKEYDGKLKQLNNIKQERDIKQKYFEEAETLLYETKEELIEKIYSWEQNNAQFKIRREVLTDVANAVHRYGKEITYDDILAKIRLPFQEYQQQFIKQKSQKDSESEQYKNLITEKKEEIKQWMEQKDPEPLRDGKVIKNRERLKKLNIPCISLYKAIDFKEDTDEQLKGIIEEALLYMGLLDALIIPPEYEEQVLKMDKDMADKYIFVDPQSLQSELSGFLKAEKLQDTKISSELINNTLKSLLFDKNVNIPYINKKGEYGLGILRGKVSKTYQPKYIGVQARRRYREEIIQTLINEKIILEEKFANIKKEADKIQEKYNILQKEIRLFPKKDDLEEAFNQYKMYSIQYDNAIKEVEKKDVEVSKVFKILQQVKEKLYEVTKKIMIPKILENYIQATEDIDEYRDYLRTVETEHNKLIQQIRQNNMILQQKEDIEVDIENLIFDFEKIKKEINQLKNKKQNYQEQLKISDYEKIKSEIDYCINRLNEIPSKIKENTDKRATARQKKDNLIEKETELAEKVIQNEKLYEIYKEGYEKEYKLGYVVQFDEEELIKTARKVLAEYRELLNGKRQKQDYAQNVFEKFHANNNYLLEYNVSINNIFEPADVLQNEDIQKAYIKQKRIEIVAKMQGKEIKFIHLIKMLDEMVEEHKKLLKDSDRQLFEDILANTISKKIRAKIYHSKKWVKKMNDLMESMNTSSGLTFSLSWKNKRAETEEQLGTKELVDLLNTDAHLLRPEQLNQLSNHFRSKIEQARKEMEDSGKTKTFHTIMKEVLDYRKWFEFQLFYTKKGERKKELTNNAFFTFSGGEKAMAMYVPLFSAVYARFEGARKDCPRIVSLDEAFAGVDENNIRDMFRLMVELDLSFVINSQILWGDYDTVPSLAISELLRPENAKYVSVIRYNWNGKVKELVV